MSNEAKDPNTLEVSVSETVGTGDGMGSPAPAEKTEEELKFEHEAAVKKVLERKVFLSEKYVTPHQKPARRAKDADLSRILEDAALMHEMCMVGRGEYTNAYAIAHTQINDTDPLRFFVTIKGEIYVNPVIVGKSHELVTIKEGCMSYPEEPMKATMRFKTATMKYRTVAHKVNPETGESIGEYSLTKETTTTFTDVMSNVVQHECQHLNGWSIYNEGSNATRALNEPVAVII